MSQRKHGLGVPPIRELPASRKRNIFAEERLKGRKKSSHGPPPPIFSFGIRLGEDHSQSDEITVSRDLVASLDQLASRSSAVSSAIRSVVNLLFGGTADVCMVGNTAEFKSADIMQLILSTCYVSMARELCTQLVMYGVAATRFVPLEYAQSTQSKALRERIRRIGNIAENGMKNIKVPMVVDIRTFQLKYITVATDDNGPIKAWVACDTVSGLQARGVDLHIFNAPDQDGCLRSGLLSCADAILGLEEWENLLLQAQKALSMPLIGIQTRHGKLDGNFNMGFMGAFDTETMMHMQQSERQDETRTRQSMENQLEAHVASLNYHQTHVTGPSDAERVVLAAGHTATQAVSAPSHRLLSFPKDTEVANGIQNPSSLGTLDALTGYSRYITELIHLSISGCTDSLSEARSSAASAEASIKANDALRATLNSILTKLFLGSLPKRDIIDTALPPVIELRERSVQPTTHGGSSSSNISSTDILKLMEHGLISKVEARELALRSCDAPSHFAASCLPEDAGTEDECNE